MATYQVNEIFTSIQGEGHWSGRWATFIRLQGCSVGCSWCDTKYTWHKGGAPMERTEIAKMVRAKHVVITGGEPTLYDLDDLLMALYAANVYTQVETSGQNEFKGIVRPDWLTVSPKEKLGWKMPWSIMIMADEVKWVVDDNLPYWIIEQSWKEFEAKTVYPLFYLMPEGNPPGKRNVERTLEYLEMANNNKWRYTDRLQTRIGVR